MATRVFPCSIATGYHNATNPKDSSPIKVIYVQKNVLLDAQLVPVFIPLARPIGSNDSIPLIRLFFRQRDFRRYISCAKLAPGSPESTKRLRITREQGYQRRRDPLRPPRGGNFAGELLSRAEARPQRSVVLPGSSSSPVSRTYVKQRPKQPADLRDRSGGALTCSSRQTVAVS